MTKMRYTIFHLNGTIFYVPSSLAKEVAELESRVKNFSIRVKRRNEMMDVGMMHLCDYAVRGNILHKGQFDIHQLIQGHQTECVVDNTITIEL